MTPPIPGARSGTGLGVTAYMLLPRLKLARVFDKAFHAMADLHWTLLFALIAFHALSTWVLFGLAGET